MNKALSIVMCYALGLGVSFAGTLGSSIDFEDPVLWGNRPAHGLNGDYRWYYGQDEGNYSQIRAYGEMEARYDFGGSAKPAYMHDAAENEGYMSLFLPEGELLRTIREIRSTGLTVEDGEDIPKAGLFIDMLVSLAAGSYEPVPEEVALGGDKIQIRLYADELTGKTNLLVTAGCIREGELYYANYITTNQVAEGGWHRLTARAIANASTRSGSTFPAFALYLDGELLACRADEYAAKMGDEGAAFFGGDRFFEAKALFPSLQRLDGELYGQKLYSVGFQGESRLDEFFVTTDDPFPQEATELEMVIVCDDAAVTNLTSIITRAGTTTTNALDAPFNGKSITVRPADVVELVPLVKENCTLADELLLGGNATEKTIALQQGYRVTFAAGASFPDAARVTATIATTRRHFRAAGSEYVTFAEAVAAASGSEGPSGNLIEVLDEVTLSPSARTDNGQARVNAGQDVVVDLHGNTIKGEHFVDEAAIYNKGRLTIFDSVGGGAIIAPGTAIETICSNNAIEVNHRLAALTLGSEATTNLFTVKGRVVNDPDSPGRITILSGDYVNPPDVSADTFYLDEYVSKDGRYSSTQIMIEGLAGYRVQNIGNAHVVRFSTPVGTVSPATTNVADGTVALEPVLSGTEGYGLKGWKNGDADYSFDDPVTDNLNLTADLEATVYTIDYDLPAETGWPTTYTVAMLTRRLTRPTRTNYRFLGWYDSAKDRYVDLVGKDAVYTGTTEPVIGNLSLTAMWEPVKLVWSNTTGVHSESNGTYAGTWEFKLDSTDKLEAGDRIRIQEIAFCVVNPTTYPKTAEYLAVSEPGGATKISAARTYDLNAIETEYVVGTNRLSNGRAKLGYRFTDLVIEVAKRYDVFFCDSVGSPVPGFLRLTYTPYADDAVFGNCVYTQETAPVPSPDLRYEKYCPTYEITGHLEEVP